MLMYCCYTAAAAPGYYLNVMLFYLVIHFSLLYVQLTGLFLFAIIGNSYLYLYNTVLQYCKLMGIICM